MFKQLKLVAILTITATLVACGGGGDGGTPTAPPISGSSNNDVSTNNPFKKYEGNYYACDGNSKKTVTVSTKGSNQADLAYIEEIYQNQNCTGPIVGTYSLPQSITATYQNQTTAIFPRVTILPDSGAVDGINLSTRGMTAQLTGSGVNGKCVNYANGNTCFDSLSVPASSTTAAIYLSGNYLVTFSSENGTLQSDGIFSKTSSFSTSELISDSANNPLKKYEGTFYVCIEKTKETLKLSATGADGLKVSFSSEVYSGANCSGSILGSYKWDAPALMTYNDATSATLPSFKVLPFSATVDHVTILTSPSTATLTGPGVKDDCVYSYESFSTSTYCFDLALQQRTISGALFLTADNQYLTILALQNGVLTSDVIWSRNSTFNLASLVKR
jgi:hypothetical protein